jgi:beta-glucosidase
VLTSGFSGFGEGSNTAQGVLPIANRIRQEQINSTRLGIPWIVVTDTINTIYLKGGTIFPATLAMGATFNVPLYQQAVAAIRDENMASGVHWVLSPCLDLATEPRGGRVGEM